MNRRFIYMVTLMQLITGCAAQAMGSLRGGENASYSATNLKLTGIEDIQVRGNGENSYFGSASMQPYSLRPIAKYVPFRGGAGGGSQYMSDTGHKIPEEVMITWRELPPAGGKSYTGELKGPYRVKVRERIPKEVLDAAKRRGVSVALSFGVGVLPIVFNWQLSDYELDNPKGQIKTLRQGGDSFQ